MTADEVSKICSDLSSAKDRLNQLEFTLEKINIGIEFNCRTEFIFTVKMYNRSKTTIWLSKEESISILIARIDSAKEKLKTCQDAFNSIQK